jgi:hypothetical protein
VSANLTFILLQAGVPAEGFHPRPVVTANANWWIAAALFACFTMLVILRVFDHRRLLQLLNAVLRQSSVSLLYREEYALTGRVSILLLLNYLIVLPLFVWQTCRHLGIQVDGFSGFGLIVLGITAAYFVKILSTRVLGSIFEMKDAAAEYTYNILLFNKTTGLVLFPVVLLMAYAHQVPHQYLVWGGLGILSIMLIYRLLRALLIGISSSSVSFFYIILYLCTLEILPFIVIIKIFVGTLSRFTPYN